MKTPLPTPAIVAERLRPLYEIPDIRLVVAFGSLASGRTHPESDIDLAIDRGRPFDAAELAPRVVEWLEDDRVDLVDLSQADPILACQISRGIPLFERSPGSFREFALLAWKERQDYEPYFEIERRYVRERIRELRPS